MLEIWQYIADRGRQEAASRLIGRIEAACAAILGRPNAGRPLEELHDDVLFYRVDLYYVAYRVKPDAIVVDRVIHGARQVPRVYRSGE